MHLVFVLLALFPFAHALAVDITHLSSTPNSSDSYNTTTEFGCNCLPAEDCPKNCFCCLNSAEHDRFLLYGGIFVELIPSQDRERANLLPDSRISGDD